MDIKYFFVFFKIYVMSVDAVALRLMLNTYS